MSFLNKLYIKVLSVALLVVLVSYDGNDNHILPQQFTSEYVEFTVANELSAKYAKLQSSQSQNTFEFLRVDFGKYLITFNENQNSDFKVAYFKSIFFKESRLKTSFLTQSISPSKDSHTSFI